MNNQKHKTIKLSEVPFISIKLAKVLKRLIIAIMSYSMTTPANSLNWLSHPGQQLGGSYQS